jgi:creatinine amidohydrolase
MSNSLPGIWMENLTWPEIRAWIERDPVLLVPIGAISKEHGHHLPMKTAFLVARELAHRVAQRLPVLIAPVVTFGYYPAFVRYPGSQHLSSETFIALLKDVLRTFAGDGFTRIAILNTGVSTEGPVDVVVRDLYDETGVRIHVADIRRLGRSAEAVLDQVLGGHADEAETSTVLAIQPELVRLDQARTDYGNLLDAPTTVFSQPTIFRNNADSVWDYSATGARGDPSLATREKGEAILEAMTSDLVHGLQALFPGHAGPD